MLATGRIYDNITFIELGSILRLDAERAEKVRKKNMKFLKPIFAIQFSINETY
jgi:hypothetical protein